MKNYEDDNDLYKVPNLGKHYSLKWSALDDSWETNKKDSPKGEKRKGLSAANSVTATEKSRNGKRSSSEK